MTKRQGVTRLAAAVAMALACAAPVTAVPGPAQAAVPDIATSYQRLMYRSLTADATMAKHRGTLAAQRATLRTRTADVTRNQKANDTAQTRLTTVTTAHASVHERLKSAERALSDAKNSLARVSKQRPRSNAAITRAKRAVTAATGTRDARRTRLHEAAATLRAARKQARATAAALNAALSAQAAATSAIERTQRRIAAAGTAEGFAAQAGVLSRDVVTQVRPTFTIKDTMTVYGTTVHRSVAYAYKRMVDDARADGIALAGGGFRTKERQIELRTINGCPDIWTAPASSCRIPTAIPGRSLHEIGLAVDVTSGGRSLTRKSKAFAWMTAHAGEYGFVNLPSEAWHWSITGG